MDKYQEFKDATKEIDELALDGFFGEITKDLTLRRETMGRVDFFVEIIENWLKDQEQYGKDEVKGLILVFFKMYSIAIEKGGQNSIDILTAFVRGYPDNPETETLSSFTEFTRSNVEFKNMVNELKEKNSVDIGDQKRLAALMIDTYRKGVEYVGKMLTTCILLMQISIGKDIEPMKIYNFFLGQKVKLFEELSQGRYDIILKMSEGSPTLKGGASSPVIRCTLAM